jgi:23S rRNA (guanosine2251-2'-O)-methyltransferase
MRVLVAEGLRPGMREVLAAAAERRGVPLAVVPRRALDQRVGHGDHQGVAVEAGPYPYVDEATILDRLGHAAEPALVVVADAVHDPHNLGSLARTAEVVGAHGLVIPEHRAAGVTPAVVRASAGAIELLPVARVTNVARALERMKAAGLWVAGLEADGEILYDEADLTSPLVLVVGGEDRGLGRVVRAACDFTVRLPMRGQTSSLNLGVAAAVVLYEVWRQRRRGRPAAH